MANQEKSEQKLEQVAITRVKFKSNFNARNDNRFKGEAFDELCGSIAKHGILQPVLLRPVDKTLELIAGERRIRAARTAAKANGGLKGYKVPAVIREMTDAEAIEFMMTENIQREDLTPLEEAKGFKHYLSEIEGSTAEDVADRCGKPATFVRQRVSVLDLPQDILTGWDNDILKFGHLLQLIRVSPEVASDLYAEMLRRHSTYNQTMSIKDLTKSINNFAPALKKALFDMTGAGCAQCNSNSDQQKSLFGGDHTDKAQCLNPDCFKALQGEFLDKNWTSTEFHKENKTVGFAFNSDADDSQYEDFWRYGGQGHVKKKCETCQHFKTIMRIDGSQYSGRVCFGEAACYKAKEKQAPKDPTAQAEIDRKTKAKKDATRNSKIGELFREKHFSSAIPKHIDRISAQDEKVLYLALISTASQTRSVQRLIAKHLNNPKADGAYSEYFSYSHTDLVEKVQMLDLATVKDLLRQASTAIIASDNFTPGGRYAVSSFVGINLQTDWVMDEEYLKKKRKAEILDIYYDKRFGVRHKPEIVTYLTTTLRKAENIASCKKTELIDLFLKSGADLTGVVPDEITATN